MLRLSGGQEGKLCAVGERQVLSQGLETRFLTQFCQLSSRQAMRVSAAGPQITWTELGTVPAGQFRALNPLSRT
ncbi:hypothetical protein P7K49_013147, partial [Saguinus oedipus]